jgi:hypothetical protein
LRRRSRASILRSMRAALPLRRRAALSVHVWAQAGGIAALGLSAAACTDLFHSTEWSSFCDAQPGALDCIESPTGSGGAGGSGAAGSGGAGAGTGTGGSATGTGGSGVGGAGGSGPAPPCSVAFGDIADQHLASMVTDAGGNTLIVGSYAGVLDFGGGASYTAAGGLDLFAAKLDTSCAHVWSRSIGAAVNERALAVTVDSQGDLLIGGDFAGTVDFGLGPETSAGGVDIVVLKLDGATGATAWAGTFGSANGDSARGIAADAQGNVLVTGDFTNTVSFGGPSLVSPGGSDVFVAKFSAAGAHLWSLRAGNGQNQTGGSIAADPAGNVLVSGNFQGSINFGLGSLVSAGANDIFVVKLGPAGAPLWSRSFGDVNSQTGNNITAGPDGSVVLASYFEGVVDFGGGALTSAGGTNAYVVKLSAAGDHVWSQSFGSASGSQCRSVAVGATGDVTVAGHFAGSIDFGGGALVSEGLTDGFVASFTSGGVLRSVVQLGDAADQTSTDARVDALGNLVVVGDFAGSVDLGGSLLTSAGVNDMFVARLAPP